MKNLKIPLLLLGLIFGCTTGMVGAQSAGSGESLTRAQVKMERDEFVKTHHYDTATESWVVNRGYEPPASMKTRAQIRAERDEFMKNNRYDTTSERWVPLKGEPKSALTREQVKTETAAFVRTHVWDNTAEAWVEKKGVMAGK